MSRVSDGACGRGNPLAVDVGNGLSPHVQHEGIHESDVVLITRVRGYLDTQERIECNHKCNNTLHNMSIVNGEIISRRKSIQQ